MITIVGAGEIGEAQGMSVRGLKCIQDARVVVFQSEKQACYIEGKLTLDDMYDIAHDFEEFVSLAVDFILSQGDGTVFVAIGDGVSNNVVRSLCQNVPVDIIGGHSSASLATAAKMDLLSSMAIRYVNGYDFLESRINTSEDMLIFQVDNEMLFWDIKARLLDYYPNDLDVVVNKSCMGLEDANYSVPCDIFVPKVDVLSKKRYSYGDLFDIVKELRQKCPWDKEQTHKSILSNLIEETYELYDALDNEDTETTLEEMGDVLLQICLHTVFELEHGDIYEDEITTLIAQKLIRRHPHVYADDIFEDKSQVKTSWDNIKKQEYDLNSVGDELEHVSKYLPSTMRATKVIKKARKRGIEITGDVLELINRVESGEDVQNNVTKLCLIFIKLIMDTGILPYIAINDGVNGLIKKIKEIERAGYIVDGGHEISVDELKF